MGRLVLGDRVTGVGLGVGGGIAAISMAPENTIFVLRVTFCNVLLSIAKNCAECQKNALSGHPFSTIAVHTQATPVPTHKIQWLHTSVSEGGRLATELTSQ